MIAWIDAVQSLISSLLARDIAPLYFIIVLIYFMCVFSCWAWWKICRRLRLSAAGDQRGSMTPECPHYFDHAFARQLIAYLGGDTAKISDSEPWWEPIAASPDLRKKVEDYFAQAKTGNPAYAAYCMVLYCKSDPKWAEKVIQSARSGDPALVAYWMVSQCKSDRKWAENVIQNVITGDPALAADCMVRYCKSDPKWAEKLTANIKHRTA